LIDVATLTAASKQALGAHTAAIFSNDDQLAARIYDCGKVTGERFWRLPLDRSLRKSLDSNVAQLRNNSSERLGGAITAALFLQEFVPASLAWAHLDISGPCFLESAWRGRPAGATGFAVNTLVKFMTSYAP